MKNSWTVFASTLMCSVAFLGCTPEASKKVEQAKKETGEAAKAAGAAVSETASDAAKAVSDATSKAVETIKEKTVDIKDAIVDKATDAKEALQHGFNSEYSKISDAVPGLTVEQKEAISGFQNLFSDNLGKLNTSLQGIADVDSAKAALPTIEEIVAKFGTLGDNFAKLPDAAKPLVANAIKVAHDSVKPLVDKLLSNPAIKEVIEPAINSLITKFDAFKAA